MELILEPIEQPLNIQLSEIEWKEAEVTPEILKVKKYGVEFISNGAIKSSATIFWDKLPTFGKKPLKQVYITDVESSQSGFGFKLITSIIEHFQNKSGNIPRKGYCHDLLWLKVDIDNNRAISLYKRAGFKQMSVVKNYIWMTKTLINRNKFEIDLELLNNK